MKWKRILLLSIAVLLLSAACAGDDEGTAGGDQPITLTLMTHDSFDMDEAVIAQFEAEHNVELELLPAGDAGTALNQAILARDNPLADVFFGVDNTFLSRALEEDIFRPYESPLLADVEASLILDDSYRLLPIDYGDVCLNYDVNWFAENKLEPPQTLEALAAPEYEGLLVVENPATSSPGLAFMLATIASFSTEGAYTWLDYWDDLLANDTLVTNDWSDAYYTHFSATGDGERPLVVSYASSPPAEVIFADPPVDEAPTASIVAPGTCFRQVEFAGIIRGTEHPELAEELVDFMLSEPFQSEIPLHMFVFPANANVDLPPAFVEHAAVPEQPATLDPMLIAENRETWLRAWTETALR